MQTMFNGRYFCISCTSRLRIEPKTPELGEQRPRPLYHQATFTYTNVCWVYCMLVRDESEICSYLVKLTATQIPFCFTNCIEMNGSMVVRTIKRYKWKKCAWTCLLSILPELVRWPKWMMIHPLSLWCFLVFTGQGFKPRLLNKNSVCHQYICTIF